MMERRKPEVIIELSEYLLLKDRSERLEKLENEIDELVDDVYYLNDNKNPKIRTQIVELNPWVLHLLLKGKQEVRIFYEGIKFDIGNDD